MKKIFSIISLLAMILIPTITSANIINKLNGGSTIKAVISNIGPYSVPSPVEINIKGGRGLNKIYRSVKASYIYVSEF